MARFQPATSPLVVAAIHAGHALRDDVAGQLALPAASRLREEDPFSDEWTISTAGRIIGQRSRFEIDLNRPRESAVYRTPRDAWGLELWRTGSCPDDVRDRSLTLHDAFYRDLQDYLQMLTIRFGAIVVLDLHSYDHRRQGPHAPPAPYRENPEINVGTGTMERSRWRTVVDRFVGDLRRADFLGRGLDVRENVKFQGGEFPRWIHERFPQSVCCISVEVKKVFMDEWTGEPYPEIVAAVGAALAATGDGLVEEIQNVGSTLAAL